MTHRNIITCLMLPLLLQWVRADAQTAQSNVSLTIPALTLLDIEPNVTSFTLALIVPTEAGLPFTATAAATNNSKWLNYSSAIASGGANKKIYVQVTSGTVPAGASLTVTAATYSGTGGGSFGVPVGAVSVNNSAQILIDNIGRSYTGNGSSNGHRLTYSLDISNYSLVKFNESGSLQLTYTISD